MRVHRRAKPRRRKLFPRLLFMILLTVGIYKLVLAVPAPSEPVISPIPDSPKPTNRPPILNIFSKKKDPEALRTTVNQLIADKWKNYSVLVIDYKSSFVMDINETVIYDAASVNKIPILAALYFKAQEGAINLDRTITIQPDDVQDYGTGSIRYDPPGTTYSIKTLARLMMQKSDNTAAYVLANHIVGLSTIQSLINSWGLTQTDIVNNKTSNKDISVLMEKIYRGKLVSDALTQEMLSFFKNSDFEDRIPALLPKEATVYHKIGTGVGSVLDAGIVVDDKAEYYIGIFNSDIADEEQAAGLAAEVSRAIYNYMSQ